MITLQKLIVKYPKIFKDYEGNPYMVNWNGVPDGWLSIIDDLCGAMQDYIDSSSRWNKETEKWEHPPQVECIQMKEKFGGLRFYESGGDKFTEGMIMMAEYMASQTCEKCGTRENVGMITRGWITTVCSSCLTLEKIYFWKSLQQLKEEHNAKKS